LRATRACDQPRAVRGLEQAKDERLWPFRVVGALAQPEIEAWLLSAFSASTPEQRACLETMRHELGFDPVSGSHRLSSTSKDERRDTKRIVQRLFGDADPIQRFHDTALDTLQDCGTDNGLTRFLQQLNELLPACFQ
jgi:hypothetical protein